MARPNPKLAAAKRAYKTAAAEHEPGEGSRFHAMERVAAASGARDPGAVAAAIGRRKYGKAKFQRMAAHGRKS